MRVLVVDDDPKIRTFLSRGLNESGMRCSVACDGDQALVALKEESFDLVLLDVMLPGLSGWDVMDKIRERDDDVGVLFLTARDDVDDRVRGLRAGGDDYVVKPFAFSELLARIHVAMRHRRRKTNARVGDLEIDYLTSKVTRAGARIDLTPTEYSFLKLLVTHAGEVLPRPRLLQDVWGVHFDPGTNVVEVLVRRLRLKIDEPFGAPLIHTVRGAGYVLELRS